MRNVIFLALTFIFLLTVGFVAADDSTIGDEVLNTDFGSHLGIVADMDASGQEGIFIFRSLDEEPILALLREEIEAAAFEHTGRYLVAYDESGQALYELPGNRFQMQLTTPNGAINMNYGSGGTDLRGADAMTETNEILLQQSPDGLYRIFLLGTGELSVQMGPDIDQMNYHITFTGIPALNVNLSSFSSDVD